MRKKPLAAGAVLLLAAALVWWFLPRPLVGEDYQIHVVCTGIDLEEVTDQVDCEKLAEILQGYTHGRFRRSFSPIQLTENTVEIIGMDSRGHWFISLNEDACVIYQSAEKGGWPIRDSETLWNAVLAESGGTS